MKHSPHVPAIAAAIDETILDEWLSKHFAISVKLFDIRRSLARPDDAVAPEAAAVIADLELVQDVLFELHEFAARDPRMHARMRASSLVQNGVLAVYAWLEETLDAVARSGAAFRRSPSFVDAEEGGPPVAMLRAFERIHPDLELLVTATNGGVHSDVTRKLAFSFRQIGAAVVRISGRGAAANAPSASRSEPTENEDGSPCVARFF